MRVYATAEMASLDSLPPDQRAVLQMVLATGRGYDQIAEMLHIDRAVVRQRALEALDALGPGTRVPSERRALITDYLLGQLPNTVSEETRQHLSRSPTERAWARVVAAELQPLASRPLPEIPGAAEGAAEPLAAPAAGAPERASVAAAAEPEPERTPPDGGLKEPPPPKPPRSSRLGGAILLAVGALIAIGVVVFLIASSGGSKKAHPTAAATTTSTTPAAASTTSTTGCNPATTTTACPVHQINLVSPTSRSTVGIAEVLKKGSTTAIAIVAQGVPANTTHNAYAVWLYSSNSDEVRLGFVNPGVGKNGRLQTAGSLPANAARYKQLLVTLETQPNPKTPGTIVLEGAFAES